MLLYMTTWLRAAPRKRWIPPAPIPWRSAQEASSGPERSYSGGDGNKKVRPHHAGAPRPSLASSPSENQVQASDDSLQVPTRMGAILGGRLSGDLHYCGQATPAVCRHRTTLCTQDKDHAGHEEFRGRWSSYLEQST